MLPKLIVIAGTNASGKSGLGIELAARYGGEVVKNIWQEVGRCHWTNIERFA
jgi:tRNA dimethylallyltransferase